MYSWELLKRYFTLSSTRQSSFLTCSCFAFVASYTASLFRTSPPSRPHLLKRRTATTPETSRRTFFEWCGGSLTSHVDILNVEGTVRRGLRFIVLIREDLKSNFQKNMKRLWINFVLVKRAKWTFTPTSHLCSAHFRPQDFESKFSAIPGTSFVGRRS